MSCTCAECGEPFQMDLMVPDYFWERIKPENGELMCPTCIVNKLEDMLGYCAFIVKEIK